MNTIILPWGSYYNIVLPVLVKALALDPEASLYNVKRAASTPLHPKTQDENVDFWELENCGNNACIIKAC